MKKHLLVLSIFCCLLTVSNQCSAQIDINKIDLKDLIGKVLHVKKGFAPKFFLGSNPIIKIPKVAEILGMKNNDEINKLFRTFRTGRLVYKIAAYSASAVAIYGIIKKAQAAAQKQDYQGAFIAAAGSAGSGLIVKFLTKGASYKAVDLFGGIAVKKLKDIFSIAPASNNLGVGLYVKLD